MPDRFQFEVPPSLAEDSWVHVSGGGLEQPIEVRLALLDGRPAIIALRIDERTEITSRGLRTIRIPDLAKQLHQHVVALIADLEPSERALEEARNYEGPLSHDWTEDSSSMLAIWEDVAAAHQLQRWLDALAEADTATLEEKPRGRGASPATDEELRAFARTYLEELRKGSHGAKTRTATRLSMNRSTVYAWIKTCQQRELLPTPERGSQ